GGAGSRACRPCCGARDCGVPRTGRTRRCFFQAEDGIRDGHVTGVQTCALPIFAASEVDLPEPVAPTTSTSPRLVMTISSRIGGKIGRASCRERVYISDDAGRVKVRNRLLVSSSEAVDREADGAARGRVQQLGAC